LYANAGTKKEMLDKEKDFINGIFHAVQQLRMQVWQ